MTAVQALLRRLGSGLGSRFWPCQGWRSCQTILACRKSFKKVILSFIIDFFHDTETAQILYTCPYMAGWNNQQARWCRVWMRLRRFLQRWSWDSPMLIHITETESLLFVSRKWFESFGTKLPLPLKLPVSLFPLRPMFTAVCWGDALQISVCLQKLSLWWFYDW